MHQLKLIFGGKVEEIYLHQTKIKQELWLTSRDDAEYYILSEINQKRYLTNECNRILGLRCMMQACGHVSLSSTSSSSFVELSDDERRDRFYNSNIINLLKYTLMSEGIMILVGSKIYRLKLIWSTNRNIVSWFSFINERVTYNLSFRCFHIPSLIKMNVYKNQNFLLPRLENVFLRIKKKVFWESNMYNLD